jgi:hypothetical protein
MCGEARGIRRELTVYKYMFLYTICRIKKTINRPYFLNSPRIIIIIIITTTTTTTIIIFFGKAYFLSRTLECVYVKFICNS